MPKTDILFMQPNGTTVNLNDRKNTFLMVGMAGDLLPSYSFVEQRSPVFDGAIIKQVTINPRDISIPLYVQDVSRSTVLSRVRSIINKLQPTAGDGKLVIDSDGKTRVLNCRLKSGFTSDGTGDMQLTSWMKTLLVFRAGDPYFYDRNDTYVDIVFETLETSFFPIPPMQLFNPNMSSGPSGVAPIISNTGDVQTWPTIKIFGAGINPTITNLSTGKKIVLTQTLAEGDVITINTHPLKKTVTDQTGANLWPEVSVDSTLFSLVPGNNAIEIFMSNPSDSSKVQFIYKLAYLTV